jgi:hypothetical protein
MTNAGPALRRYLNAFRDATSHPLALWLSTELGPELGAPDPFPVLVADVEREGAARFAGLPCDLPHGAETREGRVIQLFRRRVNGPCPACGAAL